MRLSAVFSRLSSLIQKPASIGGCIAVFVLAIIFCVAAPFFIRVARFHMARARWEQNRPEAYEVTVSNMCFCSFVGKFQMSVQRGQVIHATGLPFFLNVQPSTVPANLQELDYLTVEAAFEDAEWSVFHSWGAPWFGQVSVVYDPQYGYVTELDTDANGWLSFFTGYVSDSHYHYTAEDLTPIGP